MENNKIVQDFLTKVRYELETKGTIRIYLGHPISDRANFLYSKSIADQLRQIDGRIEVYAAAENDSINDKSNDPTPRDIYDGDISQLTASDIAIFNLPGGNQTGTVTEIGMVAGHNSALENYGLSPIHKIQILGFSTNARLAQPQFYKPFMDDGDVKLQNASAGENHLTLGVFDKQGMWLSGEDKMYSVVRDAIEWADAHCQAERLSEALDEILGRIK
ncbi:MAG TPA: hypothetical protein VIG40_01390 [Tissierellaceae bacterium]